jgi:hypothetical protein
MNYFEKHWRGKQSLAISYWINAVLVSAVIHFLCGALTAIAPIADPVALSRVALFIGVVTLFIITPWQWVGLWRSAKNHMALTHRAFWAKLARAQIALGMLSSAAVGGSIFPLVTQ